jgi:hypothetical protein
VRHEVVLSSSLTSSAKTAIYPNSHIPEREGLVFLKKRKEEELTSWHGGTGPSQCRQRWRQRLDSPDDAMARV